MLKCACQYILIFDMRHFVFIFIICFFLLLGTGCERPAQPDTSSSSNNTPIPSEALIPAEIFTLDQIAEHSSLEDCWIVVEEVVYDITEFPDEHPGGAEAVTQWCGQDASFGFSTKNNSGDAHSVKSKLFLDKYFKGNLSE